MRPRLRRLSITLLRALQAEGLGQRQDRTIVALGSRTEDDRLSVAEPTGQHRTMKPVPEAALGAVRDTLREHGERSPPEP
jgi:hypothetical protein